MQNEAAARVKWRVELREGKHGLAFHVSLPAGDGDFIERDLKYIPDDVRYYANDLDDLATDPTLRRKALAIAEFVVSTAYGIGNGFENNPSMSAGGLAGMAGKTRRCLEWYWPKDVFESAAKVCKRLRP